MSTARVLFNEVLAHNRYAFNELSALADADNIEAKFLVAMCYMYGDGVSKNVALAFQKLKTLGYNQAHIEFKLQLYLIAKKRDPRTIQGFKYGHCGGFGFLTLYAVWLQQHPVRVDLQGRQIARDDLTWLYATLDVIINWNVKTPLQPAQEEQVERLIHHLVNFQGTPFNFSKQQGELQLDFADTRGRELKKEYTLAASFTSTELAVILPQVIKDNKIVILLSDTHFVGLIRIHEVYYFIDSLAVEGLRKISSIPQLVLAIFQANSYEENIPAPFAISIFGLDSVKENYPDHESLFKPLRIFAAQQVNKLHPKKKFSPLHRAAWVGCEASVRYIMQRLSCLPDFAGSIAGESVCAIHLAADNGHAAIIDLMIKLGANINIKDDDKYRPVVYAARSGHLAAVKVLVENGSQSLDHALVQAASNGHVDVVDYLIVSGANVNYVAAGNATALTESAKYGNVIVVKKLLEAGADINVVGHDNLTAMQLALKGEHTSVIKAIAIHRLNAYDAKLAARQTAYQPRLSVLSFLHAGYSKEHKQRASADLRAAIESERAVHPEYKNALRNHDLGRITDDLVECDVLRHQLKL